MTSLTKNNNRNKISIDNNLAKKISEQISNNKNKNLNSNMSGSSYNSDTSDEINKSGSYTPPTIVRSTSLLSNIKTSPFSSYDGTESSFRDLVVRSHSDDANIKLKIKNLSSTSESNESDELNKKLQRSKRYETLRLPENIRKIKNEDQNSIDNIIKNIFEQKLNLNIDYTKWITIFKDNLIFNKNILCKQTTDNINKLNLPLALETEIKNIIQENCFIIKSIEDINNDIIKEMEQNWKTIFGNDILINSFFESLYASLTEENLSVNKLIKKSNLVNKTTKLIKTIKIVLEYLNNDKGFNDQINKIATSHLIYNIIPSDYTIYARILANSLSTILNLNNKLKDAWYVSIKKVGEIITQQYNIIKTGKNYKIYYMRKNKWHKCICKITINSISLKYYPKNENYIEIESKDIMNIEKLEEFDNRVTKQTPYCLQICYREAVHYICTDNKEYLDNIFDYLKLIIDSYEKI